MGRSGSHRASSVIILWLHCEIRTSNLRGASFRGLILGDTQFAKRY
jgi:hypothetical protein